jgi:outer membrane receptor protein involved in Fe transport
VPTLNELYRPFQVGTILTAANERLASELLFGGEVGVDWEVDRGLIWRSTAFWNRLERPIVNATLDTPDPSGATRKRVNLDRARVRGVETALEWRLDHRFSAVLAYTLVDSRVTDAGALRNLAGNRLAQDPMHRAMLSLLFDDPHILGAMVQLRLVGKQYEDDLNTLPMGGAWLLDASLSRNVIWHLEAYVAAENMLNQRYLVGRAGVDTLGQPFMARVGFRVREAL